MRRKILTLSAAVLAAVGVEAQCSPITAPFTEDFTSNSVPTCWTTYQAVGDGWKFNGNPGYDVSGTQDHTGGVSSSNFAWIDYSSTDAGTVMESPEIDVTGITQPSLRFWHISHNTTYLSSMNNDFNQLYLEAYDGAAWVQVGLEAGETGSNWKEILYDLTPYIYNTNLIKFRLRGEQAPSATTWFYNDLLVDDVEIFDGSTYCFAPTNGQIVGATGSSVSLDWDGSGNDYIIEYGAPGFAPGSGTFVNVSGSTDGTATGLTAGNNYDFYIYQNCISLSDTSTAIGPYNATAQCLGVSDFTASNATTSGITFDWVSSGSQFEIEVVPNGNAQGTGTTTIVNNQLTEDITGLAANSFYDGYIRVICGPGDTSLAFGPVTFNTYGLGDFMDWDNSCPTAGYIDMTTVPNAQFETVTDLQEFGITLPFPIVWQGVLTDEMTVGDEGAIMFGTLTGQITFSNTALSPTSFDGLYPHWDDMHTGDIYYGVTGTAPNRVYVVEWKDRPHYVQVAGQTVSFEIQIHESDQSVYFVYDDVVFGGTQSQFDYGASATIGVKGSVQPVQVSYNDPNFLTNNSCAHFFYTNCPNVENLSVTTYDYDQIGLTWNAGLASETDWIIEYGPSGFTQGTGTTINTTNTYDTITGLSQLTDYDVYVYANCDPAAPLTSSGMLVQHQTAPLCANPFGIGANAAPDSIFGSWNWQTNGSGLLPTNFNITYVPSGQDLWSNGTEYTTTGPVFADTIVDASLIASGIYDVYVQTVCNTGDTSIYVGPVNFLAFLDNDSSCFAQELQVNDQAYVLYNNGAQLDPGVQSIAPPSDGFNVTTGWGNSTIYRSTWYTFVAPASGDVMITGTDVNYSTKMAVYSTTDCGDYSQYTLEGANDNGVLFGSTAAPEWTVCGLTPGETYYILHSSQNNAQGTFSIRIKEMDFEAGTFDGIVDACIGDTVDLFNSISGYDIQYGNWIDLANTSQLVSANEFATSVLASQVYDFEYRVQLGCSFDSIIGQVEIYPLSSAGQNGSLTACLNEPINLYAGLTGNADLGGEWYDPQDVLTSETGNAGSVPGQFNYDYIAGNGVCPNDTALVVVNVNPTCDYLGIDENLIEGIEVYPNPTNDVLNINSKGTHGDLSVSLIDMNGRVVILSKDELSANGTVTLELSHLPKGVYMLELTNSDVKNTFRVVVQ